MMHTRSHFVKQWAAYVAVGLGAYVSLGTSCDTVAVEANFEGQSELLQGSDERHFQLSIHADGTIEEVRLRVDPDIVQAVDGAADAAGDPAGTPGGPSVTQVDGSWVVDCHQAACEDLFLTLNRGQLPGDLSVSVRANVVVVGGDCGGESPEFVEVALTELD